MTDPLVRVVCEVLRERNIEALFSFSAERSFEGVWSAVARLRIGEKTYLGAADGDTSESALRKAVEAADDQIPF